MSITFFPDGLVVSDDAALRADSFCEAVALSQYMDTHDGNPPDGWPDPIARRTLIEWAIKVVFANSVKDWERALQFSGITVDPWDGEAP